MKSFAGWIPDKVMDWREKFEEIKNDDGELVLASKAIFKHEEDYGGFEYRYIIKAIDTYSYSGEDYIITIQLAMEVLPKYVCNEIIQNCGVDDTETMWAGELYDNDYGVCFGVEQIEYHEFDLPDTWCDYFYDVLDNKEVEETLNVCASVVPIIDIMRGFFLDSPKNMIGTTGWDILDSIINGADMFKPAFNRYLERKQVLA